MRQQRLLIAVGVLAVALAAWLLWPRPRPAPSTNVSTLPADGSHAALVDGRSAAAEAGKTPLLTMGGPTEDRLRRNLDEYKKVSVYPPWSRAFDDGTKYLLAWNKPSASDLPMDDTPGKETTYHFDADRANVAYGAGDHLVDRGVEERRSATQAAASTSRTRGSWAMPDRRPVGSRSSRITTTARTATRSPATGAIANRFVPSQVAALKQASQVHLSATVSVDGVRRMFVREFTYAPRKVVDVLGLSDSRTQRARSWSRSTSTSTMPGPMTSKRTS